MSERLRSLRIIEEDISGETDTEYMDKMSPALALTVQNKQAGILKSIVSDLGWFNRDRTKFEDWWRGI